MITNSMGIYLRQRNFVLLHSKPNCSLDSLKSRGGGQAIAKPYQEGIKN